jgi:hypothetical protein
MTVPILEPPVKDLPVRDNPNDYEALLEAARAVLDCCDLEEHGMPCAAHDALRAVLKERE